jgi:hypothetical protein
MKQGPVARSTFSRARKSLLLGLTAAAFCAVPSVASATQLVAPGGTDSGNCSATPCLHIQQAVNNAAIGETVSVAAGTYAAEPNNQVVITKGLTLTGAGIGQTILDGNSAHNLPVNGTLNVQTTTTDPVTVSGLTIRGPGSTAASHGSDIHYAIFTKSLQAAPPAFTFNTIRVEGNGTGGRDYGFYSVGDTSTLEIANSQFVTSDFNPILLERHQGSSDIHDNTITKQAGTANASAIFDMNYSPTLAGITNAVAKPHLFRNNTINAGGFSGIAVSARPTFGTAPLGGYQKIQVSGNTISNDGAAGLALSITNDTTDADGSDAEIQDADVTNNVITGPGAVALRFRGLVSGIDVTGNQITGFTRGVQFNVASGAAHAPAASQLHFNRIVNNTTAQLEQNAGGAVNAENNWWGCNEGPNANVPDCGAVTGASVDFDPWLVLGVSAAPTSIEVGGSTSTITADLRKNSAGAQVGTAHKDGFPVAWSTDLGSIAPATSPLASGLASSTLTSGPTSGTAHPAATVDNEKTSATVTITDTGIPNTAITSGPASGVTIQNTTATFTFNSPNDPVATFQCRLDSSDPAAYQPCTSPFTTPAMADGPHVFEVRAVDVNNNADPSPARAAFIVDTTPDQGGVAGEVGGPGACEHRLAGTKASEDLEGSAQGDRILAKGGDDVVRGHAGFDCLKGHSGDDQLFPGLAGDLVAGGPGDDLVNSRDGKRDKINCGPGDDVVRADQRDVLKGCEQIIVRFQRQVSGA